MKNAMGEVEQTKNKVNSLTIYDLKRIEGIKKIKILKDSVARSIASTLVNGSENKCEGNRLFRMRSVMNSHLINCLNK